MALVVTDSKESTIEVRAIMSANSAGQTWNLRCEVREKMIDFLQREHPEALPRQRNELAAAGAVQQLAHVGGQPVGVLPETAATPVRRADRQEITGPCLRACLAFRIRARLWCPRIHQRCGVKPGSSRGAPDRADPK